MNWMIESIAIKWIEATFGELHVLKYHDGKRVVFSEKWGYVGVGVCTLVQTPVVLIHLGEDGGSLLIQRHHILQHKTHTT